MFCSFHNLFIYFDFGFVKRINVEGERYKNKSLANNCSSIANALNSRTKLISSKRRHKRFTDGNSLNIIVRLVSKIVRNKRATTMTNVVYKPIILLRKKKIYIVETF